MNCAALRPTRIMFAARLATLLVGTSVAAVSASAAVLAEDSLPSSSPPGDTGDVIAIVGGSAVAECGWPTTVSTRGCTATLIHPKAISTAQHCGTPARIYFGENERSATQSVAVVGCVTQGSDDAMICELAEAVTQVPVTPVLFGCEVDMYMKVGQPVVMVGFGQTSYGQGGGTKLWANQTIAAVESGRTIIGTAGDGTSPCPGDSGGPVFVQVADGSWRVFGTVFHGTTNTPCNSAADFERIDRVVPFFEEQRGIDITPCFDGKTGDWAPGPDCGGFFAGDEQGVGNWSGWCTGTVTSEMSSICGPAFGGEASPDAGAGTGGDVDAGPSGGPGGGAAADGDDAGGCGCSSSNTTNTTNGHGPAGSLLLIGLGALIVVRRRRSA